MLRLAGEMKVMYLLVIITYFVWMQWI